MITAIHKSVRIAGFAGVIAAACAGRLSAANLNPPSAPAYTITDLGALQGKEFTQALSINNAGQVVGVSGQNYLFVPIKTRPFLYTGGKLVDLGLLPGFAEGSAASINNQGMIVGKLERIGADGEDSAGKRHNEFDGKPGAKYLTSTAFFYRNGTMTAVTAPRPYAGLVATKSNDKSQTVGYVQADMSDDRPVLISGQRVQLLPLPKGYRCGEAMAINNHSLIAACASTTSDNPYNRAYIIQDGKTTFLGSIGGKDSRCFAINDKGEIVGYAATSRHDNHFNTITHAFIWDKQHGMRDIGSFGGTYTEAMSINNASQVVGESQVLYTDQEIQALSLINELEYLRPHAFLWQKGRMYDLADLVTPKQAGLRLVCATSINDHGVIVGNRMVGDETHAFMLTPVKTATRPK